MIKAACKHERKTSKGKDRRGYQRWKCKECGVSWTERPRNPLGDMRIDVDTAQLALRLLVEGNSIRSTERITKLHRDTICRLIVFFGERCRTFMDREMQDLQLTHLQFDEQWTFVGKKQSRLTVDQKAECHNLGDMYLWTCIDQKTKLMPSFVIGKRSADNARRFLMDVAGRLRLPGPGSADDHAFVARRYRPVVQISTDGWAGYPEAVDLAFGPHAHYGSLIKEYRNANIQYTPSEMVGTKRTGHRGIEGRQLFTICTSHVERHSAAVHEAAQPPYVLFQQEAGKPRSGLRHVRPALQFRLANPEARQAWPETANRRYDGETDGARLVVR